MRLPVQRYSWNHYARFPPSFAKMVYCHLPHVRIEKGDFCQPNEANAWSFLQDSLVSLPQNPSCDGK